MHLTNPDLSRFRIYFFYLVLKPYVDPVPLPEPLGCADDECILVVDDPADIIGNSSGRIGYVRALLEDDNLKIRAAAFGLGGGAHASCIASYNDEPLGSHVVPPLPGFW